MIASQLSQGQGSSSLNCRFHQHQKRASLMNQNLEVQTNIFETTWQVVENISCFLPTGWLCGRVLKVLQDICPQQHCVCWLQLLLLLVYLQNTLVGLMNGTIRDTEATSVDIDCVISSMGLRTATIFSTRSHWFGVRCGMSCSAT